jgi:hypothetical protein
MPITKPQVGEYAPYYHSYISQVEQNDLPEALNHSHQQFIALLNKLPQQKHNYRYAEGKWTIKEMLAHIIDTERVFMYRALSFARNDKSELPGFDENEWAAEANAEARSMDALIEEYKHARKANMLFFEGITDEISRRKGKANNNALSVRAIGFIISGHELHHLSVLKERYL